MILTRKKEKKYWRCIECDKIKGVCKCKGSEKLIFTGRPDDSEIPEGLADENFMYKLSNEEKTEKKDSIKVILVRFVKEQVKDLMISDNDPTKVYVRIGVENHTEVFDLMGVKFLYWLKDKSFKVHNEIYSDDTITSVISLLYSQSMMRTDVKRVHTYTRIAQTKDAIFYDLTTDKREIVKITPEKVEILPLGIKDPVFVHSNRLIPQVRPNLKLYDKALDNFTDILSIVDEEKFLFKVHLVSLFLEGIPVPVIDLFAEQGKGKSVISATIKRIVDPQSNQIRDNINKMPTREENFILECASKYLISWDNISRITASQSDDICRMVTGGAAEKRKLYRDRDSIVEYLRK